ncbi:hypothetical protein [Anaerostipes hominis (ex Lee et al. 2021)]|uniref:hypothetical protein n=1 Tax=Anaerostipes hominis (ex Lee et al. 2021) TaxID=2025494 RepID=UPI0022E3202B|nr:hypothetical protein [Anaerostipes hominis (ex Lee et al. 2021)]
MKYKVGDKVKIRKDLGEEEIYGGIFATEAMCKKAGNIVTISKIVIPSKRYRIEEDRELWAWTDEMLEPVSPKGFVTEGAVVELRDGRRFVRINEYLMCQSGCAWLCKIEDLDEDLHRIAESHQTEIVSVHETNAPIMCELCEDENLELKWKREECKAMTIFEIEKELGYKVKIIGED